MRPFLLLAESAGNECRFCECMMSPLCWAITSGAIGLLLLLPRTCCKASRVAGVLFGLLGIGLFGAGLPLIEKSVVPQFLFWVLAAVTVVSAAAAIVMRSPVYTAIWFALSLVGTAGLFLFQGAQFLAVATIVVYAGAIVVTFLFVIMLAQPEGHATYDRISWGVLPKPLSVIAAGAIVGLLTFAIGLQARDALPPGKPPEAAAKDAPENEQRQAAAKRKKYDLAKARYDEEQTPQAQATRAHRAAAREQTVLNKEHMAGLGKELFGPHLLSVEIAGTLLLVALVGAVAIVLHGKETGRPQEGERHE